MKRSIRRTIDWEVSWGEAPLKIEYEAETETHQLPRSDREYPLVDETYITSWQIWDEDGNDITDKVDDKTLAWLERLFWDEF